MELPWGHRPGSIPDVGVYNYQWYGWRTESGRDVLRRGNREYLHEGQADQDR